MLGSSLYSFRLLNLYDLLVASLVIPKLTLDIICWRPLRGAPRSPPPPRESSPGPPRLVRSFLPWLKEPWCHSPSQEYRVASLACRTAPPHEQGREPWCWYLVTQLENDPQAHGYRRALHPGGYPEYRIYILPLGESVHLTNQIYYY